MPFIIRDLNSGLFYNQRGWTTSIEFAQKFSDLETVHQKVDVLGQDAEAVILSEPTLRVAGGIHVRVKRE